MTTCQWGFVLFFSAGLSCQRSGGSAGNQLGPVIQTISTSELSVRINSRKKKKEEENITILCHHMAAEKKKTSIAGGAAVPGVVHYTSSTANGIYWFIGRYVNLWSRHSRGGSIRVWLQTNKRFRSNPEVSAFSEWRFHSQEGEEKHFFFSKFSFKRQYLSAPHGAFPGMFCI